MEEPTQTAADGSVPTAATERWSALPGDLLSVIYLRLVAGPIVAAACGWWRAVASTHLPRRLLPWLVLDPGGGDRAKHACCLEDGVVLPPRFRFPDEAVGRCIVGGHEGGWVAFLEAPLRIVNLFSGAEVTLSVKQRRIVRLRRGVDDRFVPLKVIFSEPPTSSGCILAAITERDEVAVCGLGRPRCAWLPRRLPTGKTYMDIAFCNGHLYCLVSETMQIVRFKVSLTKHGVFKSDPEWLSVGGLYRDDPNDQSVYMVELHGKMVIAVRKKGWSRSRNTFVPFFFVSELVEVGSRIYKWYELAHLKSLGDHALFLSSTFSKAMDMSTHENGYLHRNNIYYSHHRCYPQEEGVPDAAKEFLTVSNSDGRRVHYKTQYKEDESVDNNVEGITTVGHYVMGGDKYPPMWLFPRDL
ncbi:hypothetical protein ACQJBY_025795 [Aegilops geniculata]